MSLVHDAAKQAAKEAIRALDNKVTLGRDSKDYNLETGFRSTTELREEIFAGELIPYEEEGERAKRVNHTTLIAFAEIENTTIPEVKLGDFIILNGLRHVVYKLKRTPGQLPVIFKLWVSR